MRLHKYAKTHIITKLFANWHTKACMKAYNYCVFYNFCLGDHSGRLLWETTLRMSLGAPRLEDLKWGPKRKKMCGPNEKQVGKTHVGPKTKKECGPKSEKMWVRKRNKCVPKSKQNVGICILRASGGH